MSSGYYSTSPFRDEDFSEENEDFVAVRNFFLKKKTKRAIFLFL